MTQAEPCSILLADDDRNLCTSLRDVLEAMSHRVETVYTVQGNGEVAVVLIHGWACNRKFWRDQVDMLAENYPYIKFNMEMRRGVLRGTSFFLNELAPQASNMR